MGTVWRATDELLGREVALKQVRLTDLPAVDVTLARERTMREARIAAALHHPNIVSIFDVVVERGEPWLVLEFLPSRSLGSVLAERGALPSHEVAAIGADVAAALAAAHAAGVVHRDVKPDNILLSRPSAAGPVVKLTDFGIAHIATAPRITATEVLVGTPAYFAPETARGEGTDARSDVYSLGATLYAAVEGHPPFGTDTGNVFGLLARIGRGGVPVPRRAGPLTDLLQRMTADDPWARPSAAAAQASLRAIAEGRLELPTPPATGGSSRRAAAVVATAIAVAAAKVVAVIAWPDAAPGGPPSAAPTTVAPVATTILDPASADPCSLFDLEALQPFGTPWLDPDNVVFAGCSAGIDRPDGGFVRHNVVFENADEVGYVGGGTREQVSGHTVITYEPYEDYCEQRILLTDGNAVWIAAESVEDPTRTSDECAIVAASRDSAIMRLGNQGIGRRAPLDRTFRLAGIPACSLLTQEEVGTAVANPSTPRPRFGDWACDWASLTGGGRAEVAYYRGYRSKDDPAASPAEFSGHPAWVLRAPGNCWVQIVQRAYVVGGSDHIEGAWVYVFGDEGNEDQLCQNATRLATAAASRLPPPG
jgi:tRNA A-37 threonylcarbamoyl transferase component Bud32